MRSFVLWTAFCVIACGGHANNNTDGGSTGDDGGGGPGCGDGHISAGEQCDDGNTVSGDGCSATCQNEPGFKCIIEGKPCLAVVYCGDGIIQPPEACDDGNSVPGDGCSGTCQIEPNFSCPTPGQPCVSAFLCGDGRIQGNERCDDGNTTAGDGCETNCTITPGWTCPTPGQPCTKTCSNGKIDPGEQCDDGNTGSGDGCSTTCQIETGFVCPVPGMPCLTAVCGDGKVRGSEQCDDGNLNPGDGCSATCTVEDGFVCPNPGQLCIADCGDGKVRGNEQCDLGPNNGKGMGCSAACKVDPGFVCPGNVCRATVCGDGVPEGTEQCDDHNLAPYDGCSPTCTIEPTCAGGKCTPVCGDGLKFPQEECDDGNLQDGDGCSHDCKIEAGFTCSNAPQALPPTLVIPILYRDFRYFNSANGHPDFENFNSGLSTGLVMPTLDPKDPKPTWKQNNGDGNASQALNGPDFFACWYHDTCLGSGKNIQYSQKVFVDASGKPTTLTLRQQGGATNNVYQLNNQTFFPIDGLGWNDPTLKNPPAGSPQTSIATADNKQHNFSFTSELHYPFTYDATKSPTFDFVGDDDVWVFINGKLAVDLGGIHAAARGSVTLDPTTASTKFGLTDGGMYSVDMFQAERHTSASTYLLTLSGFQHIQTTCSPICGDGKLEGNEVCDDGKNDGSPGSCLPGCMGRAPFCGDGVVTSPPEACDDGSNLVTYGGTSKLCGPGCQFAPYCGDGVVSNGEECDDGAMNGTGMSTCSASCTLPQRCGDGIKNGTEQCDNGVNDGSYGTCNPNCTLAAFCGDGTTNGPEQCDLGTMNSPTAYGPNQCTSACTVAPFCGDGIVEPQFGEQCEGGAGCFDCHFAIIQ